MDGHHNLIGTLSTCDIFIYIIVVFFFNAVHQIIYMNTTNCRQNTHIHIIIVIKYIHISAVAVQLGVVYIPCDVCGRAPDNDRPKCARAECCNVKPIFTTN